MLKENFEKVIYFIKTRKGIVAIFVIVVLLIFALTSIYFYKKALTRENATKEPNIEKQNTEEGLIEDITPPEITIISPEQNSVINTNNVTITYKSNENGWFDENKSKKQIVANKEYTYNVILNTGLNEVKLTFYDLNNNQKEVPLSITYKPNQPTQPVQQPTNQQNPIVDQSPSVNLTTQPQNDGVKLNWTSKNLTVGQRYEIIKNGGPFASFPIVSQNINGTDFLDFDVEYGISYFYQIRVTNNDTLVLSSNISEVYQNVALTFPDCIVNLSKFGQSATLEGKYDLYVLWEISGVCPPYQDFKAVVNTTGNPTYAEDNFGIISDGVSGSIPGLSTGTYYYIKLVLFDNGKGARVYSNELIVSF